eukprot:316969-Hanusia_phi.AAC.1
MLVGIGAEIWLEIDAGIWLDANVWGTCADVDGWGWEASQDLTRAQTADVPCQGKRSTAGSVLMRAATASSCQPYE